MHKILIRSAMLLVLGGFALPSVAQAQRYGPGPTQHSRSYRYRTTHRVVRPQVRSPYRVQSRSYYQSRYRPVYRTHRASYGRYTHRPSYRYSTPYRSPRRAYVRCR